ncbi:Uncharacterised protein [Klebsiella pneumoniae]|nr:Uncharacterised protein [Klebsiella pneumoniae]
MYSGAIGPRQPVKTHRRLIPAVHLHTFYVVQKFAAVQYRNGIAKAERLGSCCIIGLYVGWHHILCGILSH